MRVHVPILQRETRCEVQRYRQGSHGSCTLDSPWRAKVNDRDLQDIATSLSKLVTLSDTDMADSLGSIASELSAIAKTMESIDRHLVEWLDRA